MCLIVFAFEAHPLYRLVLAANRDEFYSRPTAPAAFWTEFPFVLAGRDLAAGGTWLGISKTGRFAAVTNYRDPLAPTGKKSRGDLTKDFLTGQARAENFLFEIKENKTAYSGFNLLVGDFGVENAGLKYFSNRGRQIADVQPGIYGLSNALLDTNWHKVEKSKSRLSEILQRNDEIVAADLFEILADREFAPDEKLPETGVGLMVERVLSPAFIKTPDYGTRSSTVLLVERNGRITFVEKTVAGKTGTLDFRFSIEKQRNGKIISGNIK